MDLADITVVIPTYNRAAGVAQLLAYLRNELGWRQPIVVVDQSDGPASTPPARNDNDILWLRPTKKGPGSARNRGASQANTGWLVFLDDDVRPAVGYLEAVRRFVEDNPWVDTVHTAVRGPEDWKRYQHNPGAWLDAWSTSAPERSLPLPSSDAVSWFTQSPWSNYETLTIGMPSGTVAVRTAAFIGSGGFDEQVDGLGDDREFGLRLWWLGYRTAYCPKAVAFHLKDDEGGLRLDGSRLRMLLRPEPAPSWLYFQFKWFPGQPTAALKRHLLWRALVRKPQAAPIKLLRLRRAVAEAHRRLAEGPVYLRPPLSRGEVLNAVSPAEAWDSNGNYGIRR